MTKWDPVSREGREDCKEERVEGKESITIYRGVDSGPEFSDEEIEYKDVKVGTRQIHPSLSH